MGGPTAAGTGGGLKFYAEVPKMALTYQITHLLSRIVAKVCFRYRVVNRERGHHEGPLLLVSNHVSFFDPPLAAIALKTPIHFLARKTLYSNAVARWLFPRLNVVPVDQEKAEVAPLKAVIRLLKEGKQVIVFPEGTRSVDGTLQAAQPGVGFIAAKTRVPVLPIRIFGAHEALPPGGGKFKFTRITIVIGEVLHFTEEDYGQGKETYQALSDRMMEAIAALECPA
jgi:1-acyl-sn-glycerol-3-phosphate acyltransferase